MNKGGYERMEPFERALDAMKDFYVADEDIYLFGYMDVFALYPHIIEFLRNQTGKTLNFDLTRGKFVLG